MAKRTHAGWRVDGSRVYHVKGARPSKRKTFKTKQAALRYYKRKRK